MKKLISLMLLSLVFTSRIASAADDADADEKAVCQKATELLSAGKQSEAEKLIFAQTKKTPTKHLYFYTAVLVRSRFEVEQADNLFAHLKDVDTDGVDGRASALILAMDQNEHTDANFEALDDLVAANPKDPLLLWMSAVECRQLNKPKEGIERYTKLLTLLDPGPALVHQTLGNLLLQDHKAELALKQYQTAIDMEPAAWDYNCKGNALMELKRYDESAAAYQKATELDPDYSLAWYNWGLLCDSRHDAAGAAEKRAKLKEIKDKQQ